MTATKLSLATVNCKTFNHAFTGHTFREVVDGSLRWVARLQCLTCGTRRIDVMMPVTCALVSRRYEYDGCNDYDKSADRQEARKQLFTSTLRSK